MARGLATLAVLLLALGACSKHKYAAEWQTSYEECVGQGIVEMSDSENFDVDLIKDVCSNVVTELSGDYQDTHPDDIPESVKSEVFDSAFEDCLEQDLLESEYC